MASHSKIRLFLAQQENKDALVVDKLTNNKLSVARNSRNRNSRPQPNVGWYAMRIRKGYRETRPNASDGPLERHYVCSNHVQHTTEHILHKTVQSL